MQGFPKGVSNPWHLSVGIPSRNFPTPIYQAAARRRSHDEVPPLFCQIDAPLGFHQSRASMRFFVPLILAALAAGTSHGITLINLNFSGPMTPIQQQTFIDAAAVGVVRVKPNRSARLRAECQLCS